MRKKILITYEGEILFKNASTRSEQKLKNIARLEFQNRSEKAIGNLSNVEWIKEIEEVGSYLSMKAKSLNPVILIIDFDCEDDYIVRKPTKKDYRLWSIWD